MQRPIAFRLNGQPVLLNTDDERRLLWVLRTDFALTGTKYGCGEGFCGACTVIAGGKAVRSCQTPLSEIADKKVITIEGLARNGILHPLQQAFIDHGGFQCGFCTAGMLLTAAVFLQDTPRPTHDSLLAALEDNLCRCGAHTRIIAAIISVSAKVKAPV
jgi:aerobic-type carbon monoxide dehydrogenase small subunit (CoxS/CutS family)